MPSNTSTARTLDEILEKFQNNWGGGGEGVHKTKRLKKSFF